MELDGTRCYRALKVRDGRFDGRFFTGVRTTGVYCRPVCPARTPRRQNCTFFASAAAAAAGGYRPCLRCRPEASPGTPAWIGTPATVTRALRLIHEGALVDAGVEELAERLGMGARHLRRLFEEHLGASPLAVEQTRRAHFAKKLLDETDLSITQIAFSAGFNSVRRFNAAMKESYGRAPRELRRKGAARSGSIELRLAFRPPFDWGEAVGFLAPRAIPGVEVVGRDGYARTIAIEDFRGVVRVAAGEGDHLVVRVPGNAAAHVQRIVARVRAIFDLAADPIRIGEQLASEARMRRLVRRRPGLRVPGAWDSFEMSVRAIVGQQVSVAGATTVIGRIAERHGTRLASNDDGLSRVFPAPKVLAAADLSGVGMPGRRAAAIAAFAAAVDAEPALIDGTRSLDDSVQRLCEIPGIGPWTASYVAMRAMREPDAFPASDLGLRKALATESGELPSAAQIAGLAEEWRPWRSYAAMHLWRSLDGGVGSRCRDGSRRGGE